MRRNGSLDTKIKMFRERTTHPHYGRWQCAKSFGVVPEWEEFAAFVRDIGEKPAPSARIRKIDYDLPYGPKNFRWVAIRTDEEKREIQRTGQARRYYGAKIAGEAAWSDSHRNSYMKRKFGINLDQYNALLALQGGVCAICGKKDNRRLAVDHCHATKKVRGLLCSGCNISVGRFDDSPELLRSAIAYLRR